MKLDERFVEEILEKLFREACKINQVKPENTFLIVEVEKDKFQVLYCFKKGSNFNVIKSSGKIELFFSIPLLIAYKTELCNEVKKKLNETETVAVTLTTLCLN